MADHEERNLVDHGTSPSKPSKKQRLRGATENDFGTKIKSKVMKVS